MTISTMTDKYETIFSPEEETALIRILEGKFANFIYQYHQVSVGDANEDESINLSYSYDLKEVPDSFKHEMSLERHDMSDDVKKEFEHTIGDILFDIITNSDQVREASGNNDIK